MFKVATEARIRAIEAEADASGLSYEEMMQRAGRAIADRARAYLQHTDQPQITALIGPGNNGGDGVLAALFIAQDMPDALVRLYLLKDRPDDPYLATAREAGLFVVNASGDSDKRLLRNMVASTDLLIDALFGLGVHLPLRDEAQRVLRAVRQALNERRSARPEQFVTAPQNLQGLPQAPRIVVMAVDLPSGVEADTGRTDLLTVTADETVSFIAARRGHFLGDAVEVVGLLSLANLGFSPKLKALNAVGDSLLDADMVRGMLPSRPLNSHKGTYGKALLVAGSQHYYGAALLCALGCYRVGAGLVTVAAPTHIVQALAGQLPEATWLPTDTTSAETLAERVAKADTLLIGPGLGETEASKALVLQVLVQANSVPTVIDADALNLLAKEANWPSLLPTQTVLTPHPAEMARLTGLTTEQIQAERFEQARRWAMAWGCVVVLKGAHTLIADPKGAVFVSPFKTDALAKAGTGDTLAGMISGFLAQGLTTLQAAQAGCYMHGAAGVACAAAGSSRAVLAHEVSDAITSVLQQLAGNA